MALAKAPHTSATSKEEKLITDGVAEYKFNKDMPKQYIPDRFNSAAHHFLQAKNSQHNAIKVQALLWIIHLKSLDKDNRMLRDTRAEDLVPCFAIAEGSDIVDAILKYPELAGEFFRIFLTNDGIGAWESGRQALEIWLKVVKQQLANPADAKTDYSPLQHHLLGFLTDKIKCFWPTAYVTDKFKTILRATGLPHYEKYLNDNKSILLLCRDHVRSTLNAHGGFAVEKTHAHEFQSILYFFTDPGPIDFAYQIFTQECDQKLEADKTRIMVECLIMGLTLMAGIKFAEKYAINPTESFKQNIAITYEAIKTKITGYLLAGEIGQQCVTWILIDEQFSKPHKTKCLRDNLSAALVRLPDADQRLILDRIDLMHKELKEQRKKKEESILSDLKTALAKPASAVTTQSADAKDMKMVVDAPNSTDKQKAVVPAVVTASSATAAAATAATAPPPSQPLQNNLTL